MIVSRRFIAFRHFADHMTRHMTYSLEGQVVAKEQRLDGGWWWLRHVTLWRHLEVIQTLQTLFAERAQFGDGSEDARKEEQLLLGVAVVRAVVSQRVDETHL